MSKIPQPNYTQTPNVLFDILMKDMSEAELKVTLAAIRKMFGYHKKKDAISVTQFQEMTGLSRQAVVDGIEAAIQRGTLNRVGTGKRKVGIYSLVIADDYTKIQTSENSDQSTQENSTGLQNGIVTGLQNRHTKEKEKENSKEKDSAPNGTGSASKRDAMYDAVHDIWGYTAGRNKALCLMLQGVSRKKGHKEYNLETPIMPDELRAWAEWYKRTHKRGDSPVIMIEQLIKIQSSITEWQLLQRKETAIVLHLEPAEPSSADDFRVFDDTGPGHTGRYIGKGMAAVAQKEALMRSRLGVAS